MRSVAVFCGSSAGNDPVFTSSAVSVGETIAESGRTLVYGGGRVGLMGEVADAAMAAGGKVIGVIPQALQDKEIGHNGLTELHVVPDMHARKAMMADLSEGFVALPGGIGTLEELFEVWTWAQLGFHKKPLGVLNTNGFYDQLIAFIANQVECGFLKHEQGQMLLEHTDPASLFSAMEKYKPLDAIKWIKKDDL